MRARTTIAVIALAALAASCGVRADSDLRTRAANAQLNGGGSSGGGGSTGTGTGSGTGDAATGGTGGTGDVTSTGDAATGTAGTGTTGDTGGGATGGTAGGTTGGTGGTGGTAGGGTAALPPGGNGGATDVGVTASSISLGTVADLTGPVPGLFQGAVTAMQAYANYVNSQGGVFGRQLRIVSADSRTDCSGNQNAHASLANRVFAYVGSFSVYDNCGAQFLGSNTKIPSVAYALTRQAVTLPNNYSVNPSLPGGYFTGGFEYYAKKFGAEVVQNVGTLYPNVPAASENQKGFVAAGEVSGWRFTYSRAHSATESDYTTDVVRMRNQGVKLVFLSATNAQNAATFVRNAAAQNFKPIMVLITAYGQNFIELAGGPQAVEGIWGWNPYTQYFSPGDAQNIPSVATFQTWMKRTNPNQPISVEALYAWTSAMLFTQALKAAGPRATRAGLVAELNKITKFNAEGMLPDANPAGKKPAHCYVLWQIRGGDFRRVDTPPTEFRCDGRYHGATAPANR